jgi:hypothetical protein
VPKFEITTTAQVERVYDVIAADEEQARKRLRTFLSDAEALALGVVVQHEALVDRTPQRISGLSVGGPPVKGESEDVPF